MAGEGIVPPQGFNVVNERRTIWGLPMAIPCGGGGTKVTPKIPAKAQQGSGQKITIIAGTYTPTPPIPPAPPFLGSWKQGSGQRSVIIPDASIPKGRSGSGSRTVIVTPIAVKNGSGAQAIKTSI